MDCNWLKDNLSDCLDGTLPPLVEQQWREHLASCGACRALYDDLVLVERQLAELPPVLAPAGLMINVMAGVKRPVKNPWKFFLPRLAPVAAALAITLASVNLWPGHFFGQPVVSEDVSSEMQRTAPQVFSAAIDTATVETPSNTLLMRSSAVGGTLFLIWGAVVLVWYKRT